MSYSIWNDADVHVDAHESTIAIANANKSYLGYDSKIRSIQGTII